MSQITSVMKLNNVQEYVKSYYEWSGTSKPRPPALNFKLNSGTEVRSSMTLFKCRIEIIDNSNNYIIISFSLSFTHGYVTTIIWETTDEITHIEFRSTLKNIYKIDYHTIILGIDDVLESDIPEFMFNLELQSSFVKSSIDRVFFEDSLKVYLIIKNLLNIT